MGMTYIYILKNKKNENNNKSEEEEKAEEIIQKNVLKN